jgi:hypothetical protein
MLTAETAKRRKIATTSALAPKAASGRTATRRRKLVLCSALLRFCGGQELPNKEGLPVFLSSALARHRVLRCSQGQASSALRCPAPG